MLTFFSRYVMHFLRFWQQELPSLDGIIMEMNLLTVISDQYIWISFCRILGF